MSAPLRVAAPALLAALLLAAPAAAQVRNWTGILDRQWGGSLNWSPVGLPAPDETINIGTAAFPNADVRLSSFGVTVRNLNLSNSSLLGLSTTLTVDAVFDIDAGSELLLNDGGSTPRVLLARAGSVALVNDGVIRILRGEGLIESSAGGLIDLDGADGNGQVFIGPEASPVFGEDFATLNIRGPLLDPFNGFMRIGTIGFNDGFSVLDMQNAWTVGPGGEVLLGDGILRGAPVRFDGSTLTAEFDARIEADATFVDASIEGGGLLNLTIDGAASFRGSTQVDTGTEVLGVGEIVDAAGMTISQSLRFRSTGSVRNASLGLLRTLEFAQGEIVDSTITGAGLDFFTPTIAYSGPLSIGGASDIDVERITDQGSFAPLTISGGDVAAPSWDVFDLRLEGGTARVVQGGAISLLGGLDIGTEATPVFRVEGGSQAVLGSTGAADLRLGFLPGTSAEAVASGVGLRLGEDGEPGDVVLPSSILAGEGVIGRSGSGQLTAEAGGDIRFSGNVQAGVFAGSTGLITARGVADAGQGFLLRSSIVVSDPAAGSPLLLELGNQGTGTLLVQDGGAVSVVGDAVFGRNPGGVGTFTVGGAEQGIDASFALTGRIELGQAGSAVGTVQDGGEVRAAAIAVGATSTLNSFGGVTAVSEISVAAGGQVRLFGGEVRTPLFTSMGALTHTGGTLRVDGGVLELNTSYGFGGATPGENPTLVISGGTLATVTSGFRMAEAAGGQATTLVTGVADGNRSTLRGTVGGAGPT